MKKINAFCLLAVMLLPFSALHLSAQTYNDGPIELQVRVTAIRVDYDTFSNVSNDFSLSASLCQSIGPIVGPCLNNIADDESTCKIWAMDSPNLSASGWQGGNCIQADLPMSSGGPEIYALPSPVIIFSHIYTGQQVPQFFDLKLEAWEDDKSADFDLVPASFPPVLTNDCQSADGFSRCIYEGNSSCCITVFGSCAFSEADDIYCDGDPFKTNLDYRAAGPPGQWNSHGFIAGNCPANNFYQLEIESYWRYTNTVSDSVSGRIFSESGSPVRSASLKADGTGTAQTATTGANGAYTLYLDSGQSYDVKPSKSNDIYINNGISSIDALLIRRHILGIPLSSPYKIIAADVNSNGGIRTADLLLVRSMILQTITVFPGNKLWSFVPDDFVFADPTNPFPYDTSRHYTNVSQMTGQDFIGMKLGDVNNSWDPNVPKNESFAGKVYLKLDCVESAQAGEEITIPVRAKQFKNVSGMQFTLSWDKDALTFKSVERGKLQADFATQKVGEGMLSVLWTDENAKGNTLYEDETLFSLKFIANRLGECDLNVTSAMIPVEAVNGNLELLELDEWKREATNIDEEISNEYGVYQNCPNPFNESTVISFELPRAEMVTIEVFDVFGKRVNSRTANYNAGKYSIEFTGERFSSGVYYLRFKTEAFNSSIKMIRW